MPARRKRVSAPRAPRQVEPPEGGWTSGLEVRQLRAFAALVDHGSVTSAAQVLGLAQSTVSEALAALERALGTPALLRRRGAHAMSLTPAGRALLPHARGVLAALEDAHLAVAAATREACGILGVIANESVSTYLLPRALRSLRERWPRMQFSISVGTCASVRDALAEGRFHVGLQLRAEENGLARGRDTARFDAVPLAAVSLALFCARQHPLAAARPGGLLPRHLLSPYRVFVTDASGDFHRLLDDYFRGDGTPGPRMEATGTIDSVKSNVTASTRALGVLPAYALAEELQSGRLRAVAVRPALPRVTLEAILFRARPTPPAAVELIEALKASLSSSPPVTVSRANS